MPSDDSASEQDELDEYNEMYISSQSEPEDFGDDSEEREWRFKVVGEEVLQNNELIYEVSWPDWHREDGTNNTWMRKADVYPPYLSEEWDKLTATQRKKLTKKSLDIELWAHTDVLSTNTRLHAQAYKEKLKLRMNPFNRVDLVEKMEQVLDKRRGRDTPDASPIPHPSSCSRTRAGSSMPSDSRQANASEKAGRRELSLLSSSSSSTTDLSFLAQTGTSLDTSVRRSSSFPSLKSPGSTTPQPTPRTSRYPLLVPKVVSDRGNSRLSSVAAADLARDKSQTPFVSRSSQLAARTDSSGTSPVTSTTVPSSSRRSTTFSSTSSSKGKQRHLQDDKSGITSGHLPMLDDEDVTPQYLDVDITLRGSSATPIASSSYKIPSLPPSDPIKKKGRPRKRRETSRTLIPSFKVTTPSSFVKGKERAGTASTSTSSSTSTSYSSAQGKKRRVPDTVSLFGSPPPSRSSFPSSAKGKGKEREVIATTSTRPQKPLPRRVRLSRQETLSKSWSTAAKAAGAAEITIVNDIDDEDGPDISDGFEYLESSYSFTALDDYCPDPPDLFIKCECDMCITPSHCDCQDVSDLRDKNNEKVFAYTLEGLFAFNVPPGVEVIECNSRCQCTSDCLNRVAQRPRRVPIEVFKTRERGWGVRSPVNVERGKVVGLYTGKLIRREDAEALSGDLKIYCFDLDGRDDTDGELVDRMYSIDSRTCGNWTRFLNHSCEPNLQVYNAVWNTIPESNIPYLVFVATQDIPAGEEFTSDYHPGEELKLHKSKGKNKAKKPPGARDCVCGAARCRGWV